MLKSSVQVLTLLITLAVINGTIIPAVIVHGGSGDLPPERSGPKIDGAKMAAKIGYAKIMETGSALDAAEAAVRYLEDHDFFNAGNGSVLTEAFTVEMDASFMDGATLNAGCVATVKDIRHPISLARAVMEKTNYNFFSGVAAMELAREWGFEVLDPPGQLVTDFQRERLQMIIDSQKHLNLSHVNGMLYYKPKMEGGTVGAVAIDANGNIAVATSTGGFIGKMVGRIGDTPVIGGGTYADNKIGGVSCTGSGEVNMRYNIGQKILSRVELLGEDLKTAAEKALDGMKERLGFPGGAIMISPTGQVVAHFNSNQMSWAYQQGDELHHGLNRGEHFIEKA